MYLLFIILSLLILRSMIYIRVLSLHVALQLLPLVCHRVSVGITYRGDISSRQIRASHQLILPPFPR